MSTYLTDQKEIHDLLTESEEQSKIWRKDYPEFERLADNDLLDDLDENLPEVNDGSLAASLFKLPKRIVNSNLKGRAKALDRDEAWITELANMQWENEIIPNANSQAPYIRKWKDAVRKAAIYGSVPLITLFVERGNYTGADFIVAQPQDVKLEPGKVSDYDSDILFWDVYFSRLQVARMIERAKEENAEAEESDEDAYNIWEVEALQAAYDLNEEESRDPEEDNNQVNNEGVRRKGIKFCVTMQRGVNAPFSMYHKGIKKTVRKWTNPDPTGDVPIHFLYCYQDFINPYGTGIVKLAGGTQNVLDYFRQADILATQIGFRSPISIGGDTTDTDFDSIVYEQDAQWIIGQATVKREQISDHIYQALPGRISMYKTSLNQLIPVGDTSITAADSGDPNYSRTPEGVKFQANNLSIDDDDFKDNLYMTYEAVAKSMINVHFANMQGSDLMKLSDEQRDVLAKAGLNFDPDGTGQLSNELEVIWDESRASFSFEMDAEQDKAKDDEKRLEGLLKVAELRKGDPNFDKDLLKSGKRINMGELYTDVVNLTSDNDKILEDISPEEIQEQEEQDSEAGEADNVPPPSMSVNYKDAPDDIRRQMEAKDGLIPSQEEAPGDKDRKIKQQQVDTQVATAKAKALNDSTSMLPVQQEASEGSEMPPEAAEESQEEVNIQAVMDQYKIPRESALAMIEAEKAGYEPEEILEALERQLMRQKEVGNE